MQEVEVKILEVDCKRVEQKLISLGAVKRFEGILHAFYFDFPDGSLRKKKDTLRLRMEGEKAVLTFKKHQENKEAKVCEELEVNVSDFATTKKILEAIGVREWLAMKKKRVSYTLDGTHFEFDKYLEEYFHIPEFLEIEAKDVKTLQAMAKKIGFTKKELKPWGTFKILQLYQ